MFVPLNKLAIMAGMPDIDPTLAAAPRHNIELKARLSSLEDARRIAVAVADQRLAGQRQVDTYFQCRAGPLKLREIAGQRAELIWYDRPDEATAKSSRYYLVPVFDADLLRTALTSALGVCGCVAKFREIYLCRNVRIHLDQVDALGAFLEFEGVVDTAHDAIQSEQLVQDLRRKFAIADRDLVTGSYRDLMERGHSALHGCATSVPVSRP